MAQEIAFDNGQISSIEGLVTLTLDRVILHISCLSRRPLRTCQISLKSKQLIVDGQTYVRTYVGTDSTYTHTYARMDGHLKLSLLGRLCEEST